jgi:hypothetical protein
MGNQVIDLEGIDHARIVQGRNALDTNPAPYNFLRAMVRDPNYSQNGGILMPTNHLYEARVTMRIPLIYDFIQPFIANTAHTVYDPLTKTRIPFNESFVQHWFEKQVNTVLNVGYNGNNWPILEGGAAWYATMCITDGALREDLFDKLYNGPNSRQDPLTWSLAQLTDNMWPESMNYHF